jgi:hypothetical protein
MLRMAFWPDQEKGHFHQLWNVKRMGQYYFDSFDRVFPLLGQKLV